MHYSENITKNKTTTGETINDIIVPVNKQKKRLSSRALVKLQAKIAHAVGKFQLT